MQACPLVYFGEGAMHGRRTSPKAVEGSGTMTNSSAWTKRTMRVTKNRLCWSLTSGARRGTSTGVIAQMDASLGTFSAWEVGRSAVRMRTMRIYGTRTQSTNGTHA